MEVERVSQVTGVPVLYPNSGHDGPPVEPHYDDRYLHILFFEKYDHTSWHDWMFRNWSISLWASAIYVLVIFLGQWVMRDREPFKLRGTLFVWNLGLAVFSFMGFSRSIPELWYEWTVANPTVFEGVKRSVCFADNHNVATSLWGLLFALSKILELGDTAFIVARKQKLIFLHWYHHVTVLIYCWFAHPAYDPSSRWFCTLNYAVHATMYTYYALKSCQIKLPKWVPMSITIFQLMQMVMGVVINVYTFQVKYSGQECRRPYSNLYMAFAMYASYFALFLRFFWKAYFRRKQQGTIKKD